MTFPEVTPQSLPSRAHAALERLVGAGGRRTVARIRVLEVLAQTEDHLSAQQIFERITDCPSLSLSTVHRIIVHLCAAGLLHVLPAPGEARYGLVDRAHGHAMCTDCGRVQELPVTALDSIMLLVERETGFTVSPSGVGLHGLCPDCHAADNSSIAE
jgi:Fur family transcriptional regulator, ferric uptake regulator